MKHRRGHAPPPVAPLLTYEWAKYSVEFAWRHSSVKKLNKVPENNFTVMTDLFIGYEGVWEGGKEQGCINLCSASKKNVCAYHFQHSCFTVYHFCFDWSFKVFKFFSLLILRIICFNYIKGDVVKCYFWKIENFPFPPESCGSTLLYYCYSPEQDNVDSNWNFLQL